jgi:alpha-amylase
MKPSAETNQGKQVVLYFQVHQPRRLKKLQFLEVGKHRGYFDDALNGEIVRRVATECYLPVNDMLLNHIRSRRNVKVCFSISGVAIDQFEEHCPEVIDSFRALADTGAVEFLCETRYHSLSSLVADDEFIEQVDAHREQIKSYFGLTPKVFRNTELIYSNSIGSRVARLGFHGTICDDVGRIVGDRSSNHIYRHPLHPGFKILLRNNNLSDDIGFRFNDSGVAFDAESYFRRLVMAAGRNGVVTLGMDYETFGEHKKASTGIINFLSNLIQEISGFSKLQMATPSEVIAGEHRDLTLDVQEIVSWADQGKDVSAWLGNEIQRDAFNTLHGLAEYVRACNDPSILDAWRNLQTSDHFYYMSTKADQDGEVHSYFSHYHSPYEAFINYMNIISDLALLVRDSSTQLGEPSRLERQLQRSDVPNWVREYESGYSQYEGMFI